MMSNFAWIEALDARRYQHDALIVAGDVADKIGILVATLKLLKDKFAEVFFVAGNHDVWDAKNSLEKLNSVYDMLRKIGVKCEPALVGGSVWVVPLDSWHCFDEETTTHDLDYDRLRLWRDFDRCTWLPSAVGDASTAGRSFNAKEKLAESRAVARLMLERNETVLDRVAALQSVRHLPVVTFSHFVPREDLNPVFRKFKELHAVSVCAELEKQIRTIRPLVHVFGHTHHRTDTVVEGIRYVQFPLGYASEGAYCPRFADLTPNEISFS